MVNACFADTGRGNTADLSEPSNVADLRPELLNVGQELSGGSDVARTPNWTFSAPFPFPRSGHLFTYVMALCWANEPLAPA